MDNNEVYALFEDIKSGLKSTHRFTEFAIKIDVFCQNFRPVNVTSICNFVTLHSDFK